MKIYRLRQETAEYFEGLDPFGRLSILENPNGFGLVALEEGEDETEGTAILIGTLSKEQIAIDWLAVMPEYQGQGIGEKLLLTVFSMADKNDLEDISAVMSAEFDTESFSKGAGSFFTERFFEEETEAYGDLVLSLSELKEEEYFTQDLSRLPKTRPLSSFSTGEMHSLCEELFSLQEAEILFQKEYANAMLDRDLSVVLMDGQEPCGGLLIQEAGDYLLPVYYYAESEKESAALVLSAVKAAWEKYGDRDVLILQRGEKTFELLSGILKGQGRSKILTAKLSDYRRLAL